MKKIVLLSLLLISFLFAQSQTPDVNGVLYVNAAATGTGQGNSWVNAVSELSDALLAAKTNADVKQIWVAEGTYKPLYNAADGTAGDGGSDNAFVLLKDVKIYGGFSGTETSLGDRQTDSLSLHVTNATILSGDLDGDGDFSDGDAYHVVISIGDVGTAELNGLTITGGYARTGTAIDVNGETLSSTYGAGMYNYNSSPTITGCIFTGNSASSIGGGLFSDAPDSALSTSVITSCIFTENKAKYAGGMLNKHASSTITNCIFSNNTVGSTCGGLYNQYSTSVISNCLISGNKALTGGGMDNASSPSTIITNCAFIGNIAANAGGIYNTHSSSVITDCLFSGNLATSRGAGIYINSSSPTITNCTFSGNKTNIIDGGGGILNHTDASPVITNTIIWGNSSGISADRTSTNPTVTYSDIQDSVYAGTGNLSIDPLFVNLVADSKAPTTTGDYRLQESSQVINKGSNQEIPTGIITDLAGNSRIMDDVVDMGAYEYQGNLAPIIITLTPAKLDTATINVAFSTTITATGGTSPYNYFIFTGDLPAGLSLDTTTGKISGIPTVTGKFPITITAIDEDSVTGDHDYTLIVSAPPVISTQPQDQTIYESSDASFSVIASGEGNNYQWQLSVNDEADWSNIAGETEATLILTGVSMSDNGTRYRVIITNSSGSITSGSATLTVQTNPGSSKPVTVKDIVSTPVNAQLRINVIANDTAYNSLLDSNSIVITRQPAHGAIVPKPDGSVIYKPANDYTGKDSVAYTVKDTSGQTSDEGLIVITIAGSGLSCTAVENGILYVNAAVTGGDGLSWKTAFNNLQHALDVASRCTSVKQIWVAKGVYRPWHSIADDSTGDGGSDNAFVLLKDVKIYGGFAGTEISLDDRQTDSLSLHVSNATILSGDLDNDNHFSARDAYHVVISVGDVGIATLDGFTITAGYARGGTNIKVDSATVKPQDGGGMFCYNSSPTITNCIFWRNSASSIGGGLYSDAPSTALSTSVVANCIFSNNTAKYAAGMFNHYAASTIKDCVFSDNTATATGGGLYNQFSTSIISNCLISGNKATTGGGMDNASSPSTIITDCIFVGNTAGNAGGLYNPTSSSAITNCLFSGNIATSRGGGIYITSSSPVITNCTFSGNKTNIADGGGGVLNHTNAAPVITSTIIWGNSSGISTDVTSASPAVTYSLIQDSLYAGKGNLSIDPLFVDAADNSVAPTIEGDYHVQAGSPVIDKGANEAIPTGVTADVAGNPRVVGDTVDMGAYEYQDNPTPSITLTPAKLDTATAGTGYSTIITAAGGVSPYAYIIASGSLPEGLSLNAATGKISGTPAIAGKYPLTIKVTDNTPVKPLNDSVDYILVVNPGSINISPVTLPNGIISTGYSVQLAANGGQDPYSYIVSSGTLPTGITLSSSGLLSGTPAAIGNSVFTVKATDKDNISGSRKYNLTITDACIATITSQPKDQVVCKDADVTFGITATGNDLEYRWQLSVDGTNWSNITGGTGSTLTLNGITMSADATQYRVIVTGDCNNVTSKIVSLTVNALPKISIVADKPNPVSAGDIVHLAVSGSDNYEWDPAASILSGLHDAVLEVQPSENTTYTVTGITAKGCSAIADITLRVEKNHKILAHNVLTPNGDGKNDTWIINNIDGYPDNEVSIYDRSGRMVYHKKSYDNSWKGTARGEPLHSGTYYYIFLSQGKKQFEGYITIIRDE